MKHQLDLLQFLTAPAISKPKQLPAPSATKRSSVQILPIEYTHPRSFSGLDAVFFSYCEKAIISGAMEYNELMGKRS